LSDTTLRDLVLNRLEADTQPEDEWSALVLAALEGPDELAQLLDDGNSTPAKLEQTEAQQTPAQTPHTHQPRTAFLRRLTAQGFRGIGPQATLDLTPGPGLTRPCQSSCSRTALGRRRFDP
jgi:hypothetical protein